MVVEVTKNGAAVTPMYLHADLLGTPRKGTDASGAGPGAWSERYGPWGERLNGTTGKIGYTGHAFDAESGYTYMQARFYDPLVGRFFSTDPMDFNDEDPFTFNRYTYANNNPYRYADPTGEAVCDVSDSCTTGSNLAGGGAGTSFAPDSSYTGAETQRAVANVSGGQSRTPGGPGVGLKVAENLSFSQQVEADNARATAETGLSLMAAQQAQEEAIVNLVGDITKFAVQTIGTGALGRPALALAQELGVVRNTVAGVLIGAAAFGGGSKGIKGAVQPIRSVVQAIEQRKKIERAEELLRAGKKLNQGEIPK